MDSKISKICAAAIVMVFAMAAFSVAVTDDSDAADASKKTYRVYIEEVGSDATVTNGMWMQFVSESNMTAFVPAFNEAAALYGVDLVISEAGWFTSGTYGYNITTMVANGGKWVAVQDTATEYAAASVIAITVGAGCYIWGDVPAALVDKYTADSGDGMHYFIPVVSTDGYKSAQVEHRVVIDTLGDKGVYLKTDKLKFTATDSCYAAYKVAFNKAVADAGYSMALSDTGWITGVTCTTWLSDGKEWTATTNGLEQYPAAKAVSIEVGATCYIWGDVPAELAPLYSEDDGYGMHYRFSSTAADYFVSESDPIVMYATIVLVIAVIIGAVSAIVFAKKAKH